MHTEVEDTGFAPLPVDFVPMPTRAYRTHRKTVRATIEPAAPAPPKPIPAPVPTPVQLGSRVLIYKQDPAVAEIGVRKSFIPSPVLPGPRDARIQSRGVPVVSPNAMGDFIQVPGSDAFDAVQAFAVVRETLTMYQRALGGVPLPWQWNGGSNVDPIHVFARAGATPNAFYSRNERALKFFYFTPPGSPAGTPPVYTCRSLDIVAHETGHAVLDALKPSWLGFNNPPQTGALHESFGDLSAIFLTLSHLDQVEAIVAQTKSNLHDKTFLADLAEQFGLALGRPNGLRNADNDLKLSQVGTEVHDLSQVLTGAIYDIVADIFAFKRNPAKEDDALVLLNVGQYVRSLVLRAIVQAPATGATFADVANQMLQICAADGQPSQVVTFIRNRFAVREVLRSLTPLTEPFAKVVELRAHVHDAPGAKQIRSGCCGTMQLYEYVGADAWIQQELNDLKGSVERFQLAASLR